MKRRDATAILTALAGGTLISLPAFVSGCRNNLEHDTLTFFTQEEVTLLEQIAETILPTTTESPGAKATGIGAFMDTYVADCLEVKDQGVLRQGLVTLDQRCAEQYGQPFLKLPANGQHDTLVALDIEAEAYQQQPQSGAPPHYFTLLKGLTLLGYFTSEIGATEALRYVPIPGKYKGHIPYEDGEKAWAI